MESVAFIRARNVGGGPRESGRHAILGFQRWLLLVPFVIGLLLLLLLRSRSTARHSRRTLRGSLDAED